MLLNGRFWVCLSHAPLTEKGKKSLFLLFIHPVFCLFACLNPSIHLSFPSFFPLRPSLNPSSFSHIKEERKTLFFFSFSVFSCPPLTTRSYGRSLRPLTGNILLAANPPLPLTSLSPRPQNTAQFPPKMGWYIFHGE